jgi:hypothetical protein
MVTASFIGRLSRTIDLIEKRSQQGRTLQIVTVRCGVDEDTRTSPRCRSNKPGRISSPPSACFSRWAEADFQAWRDQRDWTDRKYAMWERGGCCGERFAADGWCVAKSTWQEFFHPQALGLERHR